VGTVNEYILIYICEEVRRQGHDLSKADDGIERVFGMRSAWEWALDRQDSLATVDDVLYMGARIERRNQDGFRVHPVMIAGHRKAQPKEQLTSDVAALLARWNDLEPLDLYRQFEEIHPFQDGNGRLGKILLNWRAGTLPVPFFPPLDFWGRKIQNP